MAFVESVLHPSDFSESSDRAFAHALAIALYRKSALTILHASRDVLGEDEWQRFPSVRQTLEKWGCLEPGSPRSAVFRELAVTIKKVNLRRRRPASAVLEYVATHPTDLIVLSTEGRSGIPAWLRPSLAERVARKTTTMTLFVPNECRGFVSLERGTISIERVLVPVASEPSPQAAVVHATRATALAADAAEMVLLHVGDESTAPELELPDDGSLRFRRETRSGDVIPEILSASRELDVDLIVMSTDGRDGIFGAFTGSHTERVVREAPCPVLAVPYDLVG